MLRGGTSGTSTTRAYGNPDLPLRYTATGGQRAGGRIDVYNDWTANNARGTLTFSQFGQVPAIEAPKGAIESGHSASA